jgi:hypothetical protein
LAGVAAGIKLVEASRCSTITARGFD